MNLTDKHSRQVRRATERKDTKGKSLALLQARIEETEANFTLMQHLFFACVKSLGRVRIAKADLESIGDGDEPKSVDDGAFWVFERQ